MVNRRFHHIHYINWNKEVLIENVHKITLQELQEISSDLIKYKARQTEHLTIRYEYVKEDSDAYHIVRRGSWWYLYLWRYKTNTYHVYTTHAIDNTKNVKENDHPGYRAQKSLESEFEKRNNTTMRKAFGYSDESVKRCIPKPFSYYNERYSSLDKLNVIDNVSYDDISSCYPSAIRGKLPDWSKRKVINGTVSPTKEYPFAFYIKSGFMAEYDRYDTHKWLDCRFNKNILRLEKSGRPSIDKWMQDIYVSKDNDITILCPNSDYELGDIYEDWYEIKKNCIIDSDEYIEAKLGLNSSIGRMHLTNYNRFKLAHIAAVVMARANDYMLKLANVLGERNILHIVVDGIIHKGKPLGIKDKELGVLHNEFANGQFVMLKTNQWIAKVNDKFICRHGAMNDTIDGSDIDDVQSFNDIYKWKASKTTFELIDELVRR